MNPNLGQYMTTHNILQEKVFEFIQNNPNRVLEPSVGQGHLVHSILQKKPNIVFTMIEIDDTLLPLPTIQKENILYTNFLQYHTTTKYKTIVGNPPFVRTKKGNLYIDFIDKCVDLLDTNGELIFIIPSDFFHLTSASSLLNKMMTNGSFTHIFHPHNETMFENATIDVLVFRYCKNKSLPKQVIYNNTLQYITNSDGLITFHEEIENTKSQILCKDVFDIYVGIVSGKEEVFKHNDLGNIEILNDENKIDKYIYLTEYPTTNTSLNNYLFRYKDDLKNRKIRHFHDKNWFEFGAPRNIRIMQEHKGKECIYIRTITRNTTIAFVGTVQYFGGSLIMLQPKVPCNLQKIVNYLNSIVFRNNFIFSGRFKIGHRGISNSYIPINSLL